MRWMSLRKLGSWLLVAGADACGITVHMEVARRALLFADLPVEIPLASHIGALDAGAPFPDYLYTCGADHSAGEVAHWRPWQKHFVDHISATYPNRSWIGDDHGEKLVTFLFGAVSHYKADLNWHGLRDAWPVEVPTPPGLIEQVGLVDFGCLGDLCSSAHTAVDVGAEFLLDRQMSTRLPVHNWYIPVRDLVQVFARAKLNVSELAIEECALLFAAATVGERVSAVDETILAPIGAAAACVAGATICALLYYCRRRLRLRSELGPLLSAAPGRVSPRRRCGRLPGRAPTGKARCFCGICACTQGFVLCALIFAMSIFVGGSVWRKYAEEAPFLQENLEDFHVGGLDDMAAWSGQAWKATAQWLFHGSPVLVPSPSQPGQSSPTGDLEPLSLHIPAWCRWLIYTQLQWRGITTERNALGALWLHGSELAPIPSTTMAEDPPSGLHLVYEGEAALSYAGTAISLCDFDGDGVEEMVIGVPGHGSRGAPLTGLVLVLQAGGTRMASWEGTAFSRFGSTVACADLDGDGAAEIVVGAPTDGSILWHNDTQDYAGGVHVFSRLGRSWLWHSTTRGACGSAVSIGDVDGDGRPEVVVGCPFAGGYDWQGLVVVLTGDGSVEATYQSSSAGEEFGRSVAAAPGWLLVGAPGSRLPGDLTGIAHGAVYGFGQSGQQFSLIGAQTQSMAGRSISLAGDQVAIGCPGVNTSGHTYAGQVLLLSRDVLTNLSGTHDIQALPGAFVLQPVQVESFGRFGTVVTGDRTGLYVGSPLAGNEAGQVDYFDLNGAHVASWLGSRRQRLGAALAPGFAGAPKWTHLAGTASHGRQGAVFALRPRVSGPLPPSGAARF